jgi:hypothetical protein
MLFYLQFYYAHLCTAPDFQGKAAAVGTRVHEAFDCRKLSACAAEAGRRYPFDVKPGTLQQRSMRSSLKAEFNCFRHNTGESTDCQADRQYAPAGGMLLTDFNHTGNN